jgi:hypothetical protein
VSRACLDKSIRSACFIGPYRQQQEKINGFVCFAPMCSLKELMKRCGAPVASTFLNSLRRKQLFSYVLKRSPYVRPEPVSANDCVATRKIRNRDQVFVPLQCETTEVAWVREGEGGLCRHVGARR